MAWDRQVERKLGPPPDWAECLPAGAESPGRFLGSLHAMLQINGGAGENWPRSGLEAMACGVPIVAQNRWGWREMIEHGRTGYLAEGDDELVYYAARLAYDEPLRMELAHRARRHLLDKLAEPGQLWSAWKALFESLGA
jgi:glycosyltransferase involved in cell wall biosynthesis